MTSSVHPEALPRRRPFTPPNWGAIVIAMVLLAVAVAAGIAIGRNTAPEEAAPATQAVTSATTQGLANAETTAFVDDMLEAWSSGDGKQAATYFTSDATVVNDIGGYKLEGSKAIAREAKIEGTNGVNVQRDGPVIDAGGGFVAHSFNYSGGFGIAVLEIPFDGLIANQWVYGY